MSKYRTTKKAIMKEYYNYIIGTGYCNLQYLLRYHEPFAYSTRVEGWACDYYEIDGVLISTGYSPIDSKRTKASYDMIHNYNESARKIANNYELIETEKKEQIDCLLSTFINEAVKRETIYD